MSLQQRLKACFLGDRHGSQDDLAKIQAHGLGPLGVGVLFNLACEECPERAVTCYSTAVSTREPIRPKKEYMTTIAVVG